MVKKFLPFMTLFTKSTLHDPSMSGFKAVRIFANLAPKIEESQVLRCGFNTHWRKLDLPLSGIQNWFWAHPASYEAPVQCVISWWWELSCSGLSRAR